MALKNLQQVSELYRYDALNLLSYFILNVKNIHSVVHQKDKFFTVLDYPRNFGNAVKKRLDEDNPFGGALFYKSKFLVSCA